jgi:hypothetical protein
MNRQLELFSQSYGAGDERLCRPDQDKARYEVLEVGECTGVFSLPVTSYAAQLSA